MHDINTDNPQLRLQVQWALGRVSSDDTIVEVLLSQMQNDANPLFRDKSACALASDQIHLDERQRFHLLQGLLSALDDPKPQVRDIAIKAIQIRTGQTKGYKPRATEAERQNKIQAWNRWLEEYRTNL